MTNRDVRPQFDKWTLASGAEEAVLTMLQLALDGLPGDQRAAIRFAMTERLTTSEIAARLRCSTQDARIAMRNGLSTLADVLRAIDPTIADAVDAPAP